MSASKTRILLFAGALVLFVLLFIAPRTVSESRGEGKMKETEATGDIEGVEVYRSLALKTLNASDKALYEELKARRDFDSLQQFWLGKKRPDLSGLEAEHKALETGRAEDFFAAGNRYYNAVRFTNDNSEVPALYQSAIRCFRNGLKKEPTNVDAKIMLASCYVEGSADPMEGIRLLREVEQTDNDNIKLQLSFAFFSVKSGQLDKAIERFNKVLAIDSNYIEAYLHLADAYEQQEQTAQTIKALEQYAERTDNITAKLEVKKYIEQLKTKLNH